MHPYDALKRAYVSPSAVEPLLRLVWDGANGGLAGALRCGYRCDVLRCGVVRCAGLRERKCAMLDGRLRSAWPCIAVYDAEQHRLCSSHSVTVVGWSIVVDNRLLPRTGTDIPI